MTIVARPPVKMAGGKAKVLDQLKPKLPPRKLWSGYREPFVGGGAMFFQHARDVRPARLSDGNERLIAMYLALRDNVDDVIAELRTLPYREEVYYAVRARFNRERSTAARYELAAWFIYLNKCDVNGLYRENLSGEFNVSFGTYTNPKICDADNLLACAEALQGVDIQWCDFADALKDIQPGEMAFLDAPYVPIPGKQSFVSYIARRFTSGQSSTDGALFATEEMRTDHQRLADCMRDIDRASGYFVATNSDTPETRRVFAGWDTSTIQAPRSINSDGDGRGSVSECVFRNVGRWQ